MVGASVVGASVVGAAVVGAAVVLSVHTLDSSPIAANVNLLPVITAALLDSPRHGRFQLKSMIVLDQ